MDEVALTITGSAAVSILSAWVTVQLTFRRFRAEKLWEKRAAAYERIIETLYNAKIFAGENLDAIYSGRELPEARIEELRRQSSVASDEIGRAADIGAFLLSKEAHARLKQYRQEEAKLTEAETWHDYLDGDLACLNSCSKDFINIAKRDLGIEN